MPVEDWHDEHWHRRGKLVLFAFAAIGALFLIAEHRAHVLPWLPWLFVAACPLMHLFMHHGHGGHGRHGGGAGRDEPPEAPHGPDSTIPDGASEHRHGARR